MWLVLFKLEGGLATKRGRRSTQGRRGISTWSVIERGYRSGFMAAFEIMTTQRLLFALTAANLVLLNWQVIHPGGNRC